MSESQTASYSMRSLSDVEKDQLRATASEALIAAVAQNAPALRARLLMPRHPRVGVCVTLYKKGMVRGAASMMDPACRLKDSVVRLVEDAALHDARFRPVARDELPWLEVQIALLTQFRIVTAPEEIMPGRDGLLVVGGDEKSALLLPHLTQTRDGDPLRALETACLKAGAPPDAHGDRSVTIYAFSADVF